MTPDELEQKLRGIRLTTSAALDERITSLIESSAFAHDAGAPGDSASAPIFHPRRPWLKLTLGLAAAILLAVAATWYFGNGHTLPVVPSAYAELEEALRNTAAAEWIHYKLEEHGKISEVWASFRPNREFTVTGKDIRAYDGQALLYISYDAETNSITTMNINENQLPFGNAESLVAGLSAQVEQFTKAGEGTVKKEQVLRDGKKQLVVTLTAEEGLGYGKYTIDLETNRVLRMEFLRENAVDGDKPQVIDIDYPENGPEDIYALGVPRNAVILNSAPGWNAPKLRDQVIRARSQFPKSYVAVMMTPDRQGNLFDFTIFYKKNGAYRVEEYFDLDHHPSVPVNLSQMPEDLPGLIDRANRWPPLKVYFRPSSPNENTIIVQSPKPGEVNREAKRYATQIIEDVVWNSEYALSTTNRSKHELLPEMTGDFGPLVGIRRSNQGYVDSRGNIFPPEQMDLYVNPERGWTVERVITLTDYRAPWQENKDWLNGRDLSGGNFEPRKTTRTVEEYGRTADGHWFPSRIVFEYPTQSYTPDGRLAPDVGRNVTLIYLDTTREIPDAFMNPDSVTPDLFTPK
jgi:hypothetical protein